MEVIARKGINLRGWLVSIGLMFGGFVFLSILLMRSCSDIQGDTFTILKMFCLVAALGLVSVWMMLHYVVPYFRLPNELINYKKAWIELNLHSIVSLKFNQSFNRNKWSGHDEYGLLIIETENKTYKINYVDDVAEVWATLKSLTGK